ncbi:hypothetical protein CMU59_09910 [Elizabethkingia anophelis]|nr:hypothetical protein [Elizabethkingia anophelis]MDV3600741.1 hypothetical protein [Elizabethkingia anophelis]MDV3606893.1 hypothetical protein [Elizabethkingia anophelis]MDV3638956.1 hypothetical protein [Elizabethkingia anophelis]MDV3649874.1 hypothetical protein [Elizabethkingia anophelis]
MILSIFFRTIKHFIFLLIFNILYMQAQTLAPIQLDRPDQTETVYTVPKNYFQVESGFRTEHLGKDQNIYEFPSALWKYGITDKMELRLITDLAREEGKMLLRPLSLGFKMALTEDKGILPKISFIGHFMLNIKEGRFTKSRSVVPRFRFTFQNNISENISIGYNMGMEWNTENKEPSYIYTLAYGHSITKRIGAYIEAYGFYARNAKADSRIDGGVTYLITPDFIIDLSSGIGLSETSPKYFFAVGISFRTKL